MNRTIGLITANYSLAGFGTVGEERPSASIPFGGRYRLMDFALSNMVNSRIQTVGMITPYRYRSIIDHIGAGKEWDLDRKDGGLYILPGTIYGFRENDGHFLFRDFQQNRRYFQISGDYVLASSGTLVASIDYQPMIARHEFTGRGDHGLGQGREEDVRAALWRNRKRIVRLRLACLARVECLYRSQGGTSQVQPCAAYRDASVRGAGVLPCSVMGTDRL